MTDQSFRHNGGPPIQEDSGWVAVSRGMRSHHIVGFGQPVKPAHPDRGFCYSHAEAWIDLFMECRYSDGTVKNNGKLMVLRRGQVLGANAWLANRWNWTPKTVRVFLAKLERAKMIARTGGEEFEETDENGEISRNSLEPHVNSDVSDKGRSKGRFANVISVCNYDEYQLPVKSKGQVEGQSKGQLRAGSGQVEGRLDEFAYRERARVNKDNNTNKGTIEEKVVVVTAPQPTEVERRHENAETALFERAEKLRVELLALGGRGLANPAGAAGLLVCSDISDWLRAGCDPAEDIKPVIQAKCSRAADSKRPLWSWSIFTADVKRMRDNRLQRRPMDIFVPAPNPPNGSVSPANGQMRANGNMFPQKQGARTASLEVAAELSAAFKAKGM